MPSDRPNPDKLLEAISAQDSYAELKIFFGYAAGVGKSYAMLKAAHELKKRGIDVVVGYLEAHGRPETEILLNGLETIPVRRVPYAGTDLPEMDLDAAIKRKPQVLLVDELPHTNAPGCRHTKRWQDVEEIMRQGISVYTTLNVQHLASLEDLVGQITGIQVRETVPDIIFDKASEVTLVDISPDDLLTRFRSGKIYKGAQIERALGNYFKKANLVALREIALRRTAQRVHSDVAVARTTSNAQSIWATSEKLLCVVGPDKGSASAIRSTARLAGALQAPWKAIVVQAPTILWQSHTSERQLKANIDLVESLGGKVEYRSATFPALEVLRYANENNITKLVAHHPWTLSVSEWIDKVFYIFWASSLDVLWIHPRPQKEFGSPQIKESAPSSLNWKGYLSACGYVALAFVFSAVLSFFFKSPEANIALLYLLAVIVAAVVHGRAASALAAFLAAFLLSFGLSNFSWRLSWGNFQYLLSFALTLGMGLMAAVATSRLKQQAELARSARKTAEDLYEFGITLLQANGLHQIVVAAEDMLKQIFKRDFVILIKSGETFRPVSSGQTPVHTSPTEWAVANYAATSQLPAGVGTQTLPNSRALYTPLMGSEGVVAILAIVGDEPIPSADRAFVEKFSHTLSIRLETVLIAEDAQKIYWQAEKERLRGDLLMSVGENLKNPLSLLRNAATRLSDTDTSEKEKSGLLKMISAESARLDRVVNNLTTLAQFENAKLSINREQIDLNDLMRQSIAKFDELAQTNPIEFTPSATPIFASVDPMLLDQVISNLIINAIRHTPQQTRTVLSLNKDTEHIQLKIRDFGPGIPETELEKIFDKYYRLNSQTQGAGLGLSVCRAIIEAHGGQIWAQNASPSGLEVTIELPLSH